jgi:type II secretory ATPase GspE/PulE/Tfp pilus assembly ATPase PilB-like protein
MDQNAQQKKLVIEEFSKDPLNTIILNAISNRVSDVHIEPQAQNLTVRYRIDGLLRPMYTFEKSYQEELISRIKVLSGMNITEHRLPEDGYLECSYRDRTYNIRISTLPTIYGEAIVCRIHNREDVLMNLNNIGLDADQLNIILGLISSHSGIILTTGPTGSGKTSLLYSLLHLLNKSDKNIITAEDPIEYAFPNVRQTQINESIGLTFAKVMRSIVRQDPDIVMIGEIRDAETAQMAAQASLIGTLIFSTFHTFDVPALITRLQEMGIANSVIAQAVKGIVSTRLLRKICASCKIQYQITPEEKKILGIGQTNQIVYRGKGCAACQNLGYVGRIGIYEITVFDDEVKNAIIERQPASYIKNLVNKKQKKTLLAAALEKVTQGISTVDEVIRVFGYPHSYALKDK